MIFVGIDVTAKSLSVVVRRKAKNGHRKTFDNTTAGHQQLIRYLNPKKHIVRAVLEATGTYHFDLAVALSETSQIEVMVLNPKVARQFTIALNCQNKTDQIDAAALAEFGERMPFNAWQKPSVARLTLRAYARRLEAFTQQKTQVKNQLHAV